MIDAAVSPTQPNAKHWQSTQADAAIADFVGTMLALTPSDPRAAGATSALTDHFHSAVQGGATASDALKSTFTVACLAPSFLGIGM